MSKIGSIVFLALFLGVPVIMVALLVGITTRAVWRWLSERRIAADGGWIAATPEEAIDAVESAGLSADGGRAIGNAWIREGGPHGPLLVVRHQRRKRGGTSGSRPVARSLLLIPRALSEPIGVVQHSTGGVLERAALGAAAMMGVETTTHEGWEWAIVASPGAWLAPELSAAVKDLLQGGDRLHLGEKHVALSSPAGGSARMLSEAESLAARVTSALSG